MSWREMYNQKLLSVKGAAAKIESGDRIFLGVMSSAPIQLIETLAERVNELNDVHVVSGLILHPFKILQSPDFIGRINFYTFFAGPFERAFFKVGNVSINSVHFSKGYIAARDVYKTNTLMTDVSVPDKDGYMHYGPMGVCINGAAAKTAKKIIVQVNKHQPHVRGVEHKIHVSEVDYICEYDHPLPQLVQEKPTEIDDKIADFVIPHIPDGATIQLGLGSLSNAIGYRLAEKKNLSAHTEMFTDSMVTLAKQGVMNGNLVAGFAVGSQELYDFVGTGKVELKPIRITNDPREIAKCDNMMSINVTLMMDLTGQACSESIGFQQYSGTGGQADFVRGAAFSKGGKSFLCLPSIYKSRDGQIKSTIVATFPPGSVVTTPRSDTMYVVTEYGIADLFCQPIRERVNSMISIAHPDFRDSLRKEAIAAGLIRA
ncbi:MAG: acetyl-CoA hydrolase/transferase family protein [Syntrophales bacterium]